MTLLIWQTVVFALALLVTINIIVSTWVYAAWVSNSNVDKFKFDFGWVVYIAAILWAVFFLLCNL